MLYLLAKALISGALIAIASEVAKRSPSFGALIVSLPLVSLLAFIWLWHDTGDKQAVGSLSKSTFWFVLPSLPMFLTFPALLKGGFGFWTALGLACAVTVTLYFAMVFVMARLGVTL
jgi:hypothetical protein